MTGNDCERVLSKLDELVDDALAETDQLAVLDHLESCASCRAELRATEELLAAASALPGLVLPDRDLWSEISERIEAGRVVRPGFPASNDATKLQPWLAVAAAALLVISISIAYMAGMASTKSRVATVPPAESGVMRAAYGHLATDLELARDQLRETVELRRDELTPETWSVVMENMTVIDDAIERIEAALSERPGDDRLNRQLTGAYRRQIALLQRAATLPSEV
jgi:hypothetical protein